MFGTRFAAWMVDATLLFGFQWVLVMVMSRLAQAAGMVSGERMEPEWTVIVEGPSTALWVLVFLVVVVTSFGYHVWFDGKVGATPAKRWFGLAVVASSPGDPVRPIGLGPGVVRALVRQGVWVWALLFLAASPVALDVPGVVFFGLLGLSLLTFLVGAFSVSGLALHDLASGSVVVQAPATNTSTNTAIDRATEAST